MRSLTFMVTLLALSASAGDGACKLVHPGPDGRLVYVPEDRGPEEPGNIIPDFSCAGYRSGGVRIPDVPVAVTLAPGKEGVDDTARVQAAIEKVEKLPLGHSGFRGAVLLTRGRYEVAHKLEIGASGVVLRGEGQDEKGTLVVFTARKPDGGIQILGGRRHDEGTVSHPIADKYVPVGARIIHVEGAHGLAPGDTVLIHRPATPEWHKAMVHGGVEIVFDRVVAAVNGNEITIDAPLVHAVDQKYGGGTILKYKDARIENCGVEDLRGDCLFDTNKRTSTPGYEENYQCDEEHPEYLVRAWHSKNVWVRRVTSVHFQGCVTTGQQLKWATIEDCTSLEPISIIDGGRRYPFQGRGQFILFQRCHSEKARHDFCFTGSGNHGAGPNVYLDCVGVKSYHESGAHQAYFSGHLYDNIHISGRSSAVLQAEDRRGGWQAVNHVFWNCKAEAIVLEKPPTAQNYAIGCVGKKSRWNGELWPFGYFESHGVPVTPRSLYLKQLEDRLGPQAVLNIVNETQPEYRLLQKGSSVTAAAPPARAAAVAANTKPADTPAPKKVERKKPSPEALAAWDAKLKARVLGEIKSGKRPRFLLSSMKQDVEIVELDDRGGMKLSGAGIEIPYSWPSLSLDDHRSLALHFARGEEQESLGMAAFYYLANGLDEQAEKLLEKVTNADVLREVRGGSQ